MNRKLIKVIVPLLILFEISCVFLTFRSYQNRDVDKIIEKTEIDNQRFSMYKLQSNGEYELVTDTNFFPTWHDLNTEYTKCVDNDDVVVEDAIKYMNGKLILTSNKTVFCSLYFDPRIDIKVNVSTDGNAGVVPQNLKYTTALSCESNSDISWDYKNNRLEIGSVSVEESRCNLNYTTDNTAYPSLISVVENATASTNNRYVGINPNNYVLFNGDLWRIISSLPTLVEKGGERINLVKIIRNESVGAIAYDAKYGSLKTAWGENTLSSLLNAHYYTENESNLNGNSHAGCYKVSQQVASNCDFTASGIVSGSYYGKMLEDVYWDIGKHTAALTAEESYASEIQAQSSTKSYVGLISSSDYKYSLGNDTNSWLDSNAKTWCTNTANSETSNNILTNSTSTRTASSACEVFPAVYLNASVYIKEGTGTLINPYIIGM